MVKLTIVHIIVGIVIIITANYYVLYARKKRIKFPLYYRRKMVHGETKEQARKMEECWDQVMRWCDGYQSECLSAIKEVFINTLNMERSDFTHIHNIYDRIVNTEHPDCGKWHIKNNDLVFYAELIRHGQKQYTDLPWGPLGEHIRAALYSRRKAQTYMRYKNNGGIRHYHKKLLARLNWHIDFSRSDNASIFAGGKRPFGNSAIELDIINILGWKTDHKKDIPEAMLEKCWEVFDELVFALEDVLKKNKEG